ncbi:MAG: GAF domain-containing protein [Candidatus Omnitrophica bacterium]|nr:GAF domain-containing protein [Candidatus Omnitrophota bacterium]MBU1128826.1 GAF domain-containing protein [Candidatus Omnitrophota bacterium]MBU1852126.1 GAF domain-containing protein [Candidatus Omnitrophota bacterium]
MTIYTISSLLASLVCIFLSMFVLCQKNKNVVHRNFILVTMATGIWCLFPIIAYNDRLSDLFLSRAVYLFAILAPALFLRFILSTIEKWIGKIDKIVLRSTYIICVFFLLFAYSPFFILDIRRLNLSSKIVPGGVFYAFIAFFFVICIYAFCRLYAVMMKTRTRQLYYIFWGFFIALIGGFVHFLPVFNIQEMVPHDLFVIVYTCVIFYAIVRHQLLGIDVIIKRTLVFTGLFAASYAVFACFAYLGSLVFENMLENRWIALFPSVFVIVLILRPLENVLVNVTDKFLFQKKYDYKELLKTFADDVLTVLNIGVLGGLTANKLSEIMKLRCVSVLLRDDDDSDFKLVASVGEPSAKECVLPCCPALIADMEKSGYCMIEPKGDSGDVKLSSDTAETIKTLGGSLVISLRRDKSILGLLVLGAKKSDEDFTRDDIDILLPLAGTIAIAITNARLIAKLSQAQAQAAQREKMAVIGTLSAGINHEICNPLGIIRGQCELFILNKEDGFYENADPAEVIDKAQEIMEKVINETDRASSITKRLSAFSKPSKDEKENDVSVEKELEEVMALLEHDLKLDNVEIQKMIPKNLPNISADRKQMQEIFFNLIRNAAQAIKGRGKILIKASEKGNNVQINIEDTGSGITREQLAQIWDPFFTTKEPGSGTGLGLFIVKQIVERNNGRISVDSEPGKGTSFKLLFNTALSIV